MLYRPKSLTTGCYIIYNQIIVKIKYLEMKKNLMEKGNVKYLEKFECFIQESKKVQ